jgi:type IV secretory pathway component VirB8
MELQDFLTNKNKSNQSFKTQNLHNSSYQSHNSYCPREGNFNWPNLINGIKNNKKIRNIAIFVAVILLALVIGLIAILLPLIVRIFDYLMTTGISGLIDAVMKFLKDVLSITK